MKAKLIKKGDEYILNPSIVGHKLSKQNCDEIFGVFDVEKLAMDWRESTGYHDADSYSYILGFNKAVELNKDKVFTLEEVMLAWDAGVMSRSILDMFSGGLYVKHLKEHRDSYCQSLQQPTEIEVEIELICPHPSDTYRCGIKYGCDEDGCNHPDQVPYLDSEGCLILKKI
jgi:hypothetical protein